MRKIFVILLFSLILSQLLTAGEKGTISVNPWVGYSFVNLDDFKYYISDRTAIDKASGYTYITTIKYAEGPVKGINIEYYISKNISIGSKISYLKIAQSQQGYFYDYNIGSNRYIARRYSTYDLSFVPIMIGINYNKDLSKKITLNAGSYIGIGLATLNYEYKATSTNPSYIPSNKKISFSGNTIVMELATGFDYKITKIVSFNVNAGYQLAKVSEMTANGAAFINQNSEVVEFDFSGLSIYAGLNIKF